MLRQFPTPTCVVVVSTHDEVEHLTRAMLVAARCSGITPCTGEHLIAVLQTG
jgi:hypothetical protein